MGNIIELPRAKELEESVSALRRAAAEAICANISLVYVEGRAIEMNYRLAFGELEIAIFDTYCRTLRLRRKKEVIRGKITRQAPLSVKILEAWLDEELARYEGELLRKKGIVTGYPDGSLGLDRPIKRSEVATLLTKIARTGTGI